MAKRKKPVRRKVAGLYGTCFGRGRIKRWEFQYPTDIGTLTLKASKRLGEWYVSYGEMYIGSSLKLANALNKAKANMDERGYTLTSGY